MAWLDANPPVRSQFRHPRREKPSGVIVLHSAENVPDLNPPDTGAEAVAKFIRTRTDPGSYHTICDSDTSIRLVEYADEAFQDGTGSNPHAIAISGAFRTAQWSTLPEAWRVGVVEQMARAALDAAHWLHDVHGVDLPAVSITRAQSDARVPGFITHAQRDPARRTDPGAECARLVVLRYAALAAPAALPPLPPKEPNLLFFVQQTGQPSVYLTDFITRRGVASVPELNDLKARALWIRNSLGIHWIYDPDGDGTFKSLILSATFINPIPIIGG